MKKVLLFIILFAPILSPAQSTRWADGNSYYQIGGGEISAYTLPANERIPFVTKQDLTPAGRSQPISVRNFFLSADKSKVLIFTNSKKVWRLYTRGDYWVLDLKTESLKQIGKGLPESSLLFAKLSPDGTQAAYVSNQNLYVEDLAGGKIKAITRDGNRKLINGTFDWVYEEEFACRDGFQWSPDSKHIAYWQLDANQIRDYYMINNTDSVYSKIIPVEYPTAGETPSPAKIGVADISTSKTTWINIPGDPKQNYLPRLEWNNANEVFVQQLNRKQNESRIFSCNTTSGNTTLIYTDKDEAWIDLYSPWENVYALDFRHYFKWLNAGKEFLWISERWLAPCIPNFKRWQKRNPYYQW